jgi:hypothetical protein
MKQYTKSIHLPEETYVITYNSTQFELIIHIFLSLFLGVLN